MAWYADMQHGCMVCNRCITRWVLNWQLYMHVWIDRGRDHYRRGHASDVNVRVRTLKDLNRKEKDYL